MEIGTYLHVWVIKNVVTNTHLRQPPIPNMICGLPGCTSFKRSVRLALPRAIALFAQRPEVLVPLQHRRSPSMRQSVSRDDMDDWVSWGHLSTSSVPDFPIIPSPLR